MILTVCLVGLITGCTLTETFRSSPIIPPFSDASGFMEGICFEAAMALSGQVFVITEQAQLDAAYDQIDASRLCRRQISRKSFDFTTGRILIGTWTYTPAGCTANHDLTHMLRDESARTLTLRYKFSVGGDCPYELVRPLWVALEGASGFNVILDIQR